MYRTSVSSLGKRDPDGGIGSKGLGRRDRVGGNGSEGTGRRVQVRGIRIGDFTKKISKSTNLFCCFIHFEQTGILQKISKDTTHLPCVEDPAETYINST